MSTWIANLNRLTFLQVFPNGFLLSAKFTHPMFCWDARQNIFSFNHFKSR